MRYYNFLNNLKIHFDVRRLRDWAQPSDRSVCLLRHDVDWDVEIPETLLVAEMEHSLGIHSSYYLIPSIVQIRELFFRSGTLAIEAGLKLQDMGHEVGLHNNALARSIQLNKSYKEVFEEELLLLRDRGIRVDGTSAHGDPLCRKGRVYPERIGVFANYEIFKQCVSSCRQRNVLLRGEKEGILLHTLDLNDYKLYETYFLPRDYYITRSKGSWRALKKEDEWGSTLYEDSSRVVSILKFLRKIAENKVVIQMNIHCEAFTYD